jgi:hypothetical protein
VIAYFRSLDRKGAMAGMAAVALLSSGIVLGSHNLRDFDPMLLSYTFGVLFAAFAVAYRYAVWLQRPPTRMYWRRGWRLLLHDGLFGNLVFAMRSAYVNLMAQRFIRKRGFVRWLIHFSIAWGTVLAAAYTFPLVFGWLSQGSRPDRPEVYRVEFLGMALFEVGVYSVGFFLLKNVLNISAVMVIVGVGLSLHRRLRNAGAMSRQQFGNDLMPLVLLLAISLTGLMLTFSNCLLDGAGSKVLSLIHALTVVATLLYIPYGKFFHIFQRPAQLGVILYKRANETGPRALCRACGEPFAGTMHAEDLGSVLGEMGFEFDPAHAALCPRCKRRLLGAAHARLAAGSAERGAPPEVQVHV